MNKKLTYVYRSDADIRQQNNPYTPFDSYTDYKNWLFIWVAELNEIVAEIPPLLIADIWIHDIHFRQIFRKVTIMAVFIHYERTIQSIMPWCYVDLKEYSKRFDGIDGEELLKQMRR